ncbi:MAG: hypothetical protein EON54_25260 [Alcaligenaceae bacterium]|nr:MAG: hypothetical protein EON54_25260 [Alcaligenaceae bacterium]
MLTFFQVDLGFNGVTAISLTEMRAAIAGQLALDQRSPFNDRVATQARRLRDLEKVLPGTIKRAVEKLDTWVLRLLHAPDTPFNRRWGRKFLMAVVGRATRPGCSMRTAWVVAGPQGIGKTFFMECIVGEENLAIMSEANSAGKDSAITYASCLIAVHDEMNAMSSRDARHIKSDISMRVDKVRLPFGINLSSLPRRCVFIVPVDSFEAIVGDPAGLHRWAVLNLLDQDWPKGKKFDFAGLEAEADDLLGAALIAVESEEAFDEVEGADESAAPMVKTDPMRDAIVEMLGGVLGASLVKRGVYNGKQAPKLHGRRVVLIKLSEIARAMGINPDMRGGGSAAMISAVTKLGFQRVDEALSVRNAWLAEEAELAKIVVITEDKMSGQ